MLVCLSPNGRAEYTATTQPTRLLVGTVKGVSILERDNRTWQLTGTSLAGLQISSLVPVPSRGLVFAGIAGHGLYASADEGLTWELRANSLTIDHVFAMAVDERGPEPVLYAGTLPPALYRSRDLGASWEELPSLNQIPGADKWNFRAPPGAPHVKNIAFHPTEPDTLFVCIEQGGLMVSRDSGRTWREVETWFGPQDTFYRDSHRVAVSRADPSVVYMATGDGLCKSTDGGASWERLTSGAGAEGVGYPDALFIDPFDASVVYIAGAGGHPGTWDMLTSRASFLRGADGGRAWKPLRAGLPDPLRGNIEAVSMVSWGDDLAFFAGTAVGEVYASDDGARSWRLIAEMEPISKAGHFRKFLSPEERERVERELMSSR
jgi:photosystem II stability/assembly factor-like uncharacterized protein